MIFFFQNAPFKILWNKTENAIQILDHSSKNVSKIVIKENLLVRSFISTTFAPLSKSSFIASQRWVNTHWNAYLSYILVLSMTHKNPLDFEVSCTTPTSAATDDESLLKSWQLLSRIILSKQDAVSATNQIMLASIFLVYAFLTSYGAEVAQQRGRCEISINKK